ncbi:MAG TPA: alpha-glucosidase C-terminal domain-containing protein, partial [Chitinophagaceae bacterium]|nr:alpha-glucosidase C-terminal domain-containing protein [Chitinophagaceae bacterium]
PLEHPDYMQVFDAAYTWTWMHKTEDFYKKQIALDTLITILKRYDTTPGMKAWFTSNHDENSWNGTEYEKYGEAAAALAVFSCTWPGIPLIYNGQELPNLKRLKFFEKDIIEWKKNYELHDFYKTLLNLHKQNPALNGDDNIAAVYRISTSANDKLLVYLRKNEQREVLVLLNLSSEAVDFKLNDSRVEGKFEEVFTREKMNISDEGNFKMRPWNYLVFEK